MVEREIPGFADLRLIGRGGFSTVYSATQTRFGRRVALKVLNLDLDEAGRKRFERECLATGMLSDHQNAVTIHDAGETPDGHPWLALEMLPGGTLAANLGPDGTLPPDDVVRIGRAMADVLAVAHEAGIMHRDVKPTNILLAADGTPKLVDFGISHLTSDPRYATSSTASYSPAHVSPEQLSDTDVTTAADVYSLGSTLYSLLEGHAPHARPGDTVHQILTRKIQGATPQPTDRTPIALLEVLEPTLSHTPADRPTARELGAQLGALGTEDLDDATVRRPEAEHADTLEDDTVRRPGSTASPAPIRSRGTEESEPKNDRRRRRVLVLAGGLVAVGTAVAGIAWTNGDDGKLIEDEPPTAGVSEDAATTVEERPEGSEATPSTSIVRTPTSTGPEDEAVLAAAISIGMTSGFTEAAGLTAEDFAQAECTGLAIVEAVGVERLAELDVTSESVEGGFPYWRLEAAGASDAELESIASAYLGCGGFLVDDLVRETAPSASVADCVLVDAGFRSALIDSWSDPEPSFEVFSAEIAAAVDRCLGAG